MTTDGRTVIAAGDISNGQNVWQAMGGMQVGSIWGHGGYVAPDWTADYLHREALYILEKWANAEFTKDYGALNSEQQAVLRQRLQDTLRRNNYDAQTGRLTIEPVRAETIITTLDHMRHWRETRRVLERSKRRRRERSSQFLKLAGCIIVTDEPHNVGDPFSSGVTSIKSMEVLPARAEIDVRCRRATRHRREIESSIRRRDRRRIIREWALHRQDGIFGTDKGYPYQKFHPFKRD